MLAVLGPERFPGSALYHARFHHLHLDQLLPLGFVDVADDFLRDRHLSGESRRRWHFARLVRDAF